ncbi:TetR/AcrR family transcriptional regulator [Streptomyces sanglieri]|uniref:TetR/AcrR family transcriptional regulator n=1 Tax=Streptomyces sanglieri TaxID=193460 RepID=A0ABW2X192_9ACTN|nr:TetR/AcrR family transcriptional regulator [Streptomyces sp. Wh19]MDV9194755.1 TetR/AcrR family transcriptional regulator [Streptomyces sp. Wh19]
MQNTSNTRGASRDPRARRTRAQLRRAVLDLSTERDLDTVTMADIAERAEVNRATVYLHYKDREDLLLDATDSTMSGIVDAVRACRLTAAAGLPTAESDPAPGHLVKLFTHVDRHRALYGRMLGEDGSPRFIARLQRRLAQAWYEQLTAADAEKPAEGDLLARAHYVSGGLVALITQWAQGEFDTDGNSTDTAVQHLSHLTWSMIQGRA